MRRQLKLVIVIGLVMAHMACSFPRPRATILSLNGTVISVVMGEGIARSYAHVGVVKALEEADIPIHLVVGSGLGSLMAALYANKGRANDMEWHAMSFKRRDYVNANLLGTSRLTSGSRIQKFLKSRLVHTDIKDFPIPYISVSTDLKTGDAYIFEEGPIIKAVQAGVAIPSIFKPVSYGEKLLVSGEISRGIPVDVALQKGADVVIAINLTQGIEQYRFSKARDMTLQSYKITSLSLSKNQLKKAHLVITPDVSHISVLDFSRRREAMLAGYKAMQDAMPALHKILDIEKN